MPLRVTTVGDRAYALSLNSFPSLALARAELRRLFPLTGPLAIMDDHGQPPHPRDPLSALRSWTWVDGMDADSWANGHRTIVEWSGAAVPTSDNLADGPDVPDYDYVLRADPDGTVSVWQDRDRDGIAEALAPGEWEFRAGGVGDFDAPGLPFRTYNLPAGTLIEAEDGDAETPTLHTFLVDGTPPYNYPDPFPVPKAAFGVGDPIDQGTQQAQNAPFFGGVVFVGSEGEYPCNGIFDDGGLDALCNAKFARPVTILPDDDGYSVGTFFVGVEVRFKEIGRQSGAVMQEQPTAGRATGAADMEFLRLLSIEQNIGGVNAYKPFIPAGRDTPIPPASLSYAPTGSRVDVFQYRRGLPGQNPGEQDAPFPSYTGPPGDTRQCVANPFHILNTTWQFRSVYIVRQVRGVGPEGTDTTRTRIGTGGDLYYGKWQSQSFTYCPHTNAAALTVSDSLTLTGLEVYTPEPHPDFPGFTLEVYNSLNGQPYQRLVRADYPTFTEADTLTYLTGQQTDVDGFQRPGGGAPVLQVGQTPHSNIQTAYFKGESAQTMHLSWGACPGANKYFVVVQEANALRQYIVSGTDFDIPVLPDTLSPRVLIFPSFPAGKQGSTNAGGGCPPRGYGYTRLGTYYPIREGLVCARLNTVGPFLYEGALVVNPQSGVRVRLADTGQSTLSPPSGPYPTNAELQSSVWMGCSGDPAPPKPPDPYAGTVEVWRLDPQREPEYLATVQDWHVHGLDDLWTWIHASGVPALATSPPAGTVLLGYENKDELPAPKPWHWLLPEVYDLPVVGKETRVYYLASDWSLTLRAVSVAGVVEEDLEDMACLIIWRKDNQTQAEVPAFGPTADSPVAHIVVNGVTVQLYDTPPPKST